MQIPSTTAAQREVLIGTDVISLVQENLSLLLPVEKAWQPSDMLPNLTGEDWREQLTDFRNFAKGLEDRVLVVLVGGMITEEALPNYSVALNLIAQDYTGVGEGPWAQWLRGWTAEENRHGDVLNAFLRLTGRVDMRAVETTVHYLLRAGFEPRAYPDLYAGLVYTSFQERATRISHDNVGKLAAANGAGPLGGICRKIAGEEARHETFYTRAVAAVMTQDPEGAVITFGTLLRKVIAMPGRHMYDGCRPGLFERFATIAQRAEVYTSLDYADIIDHLVETWGIAKLSLSGKGARMQEFVCNHAERIRSFADRLTEEANARPPEPFSWIFGRAV